MEKDLITDSILSAEELIVLDLLRKAWNQFLLLPDLTGSQKIEFMQSAHRLQDLVLARPALREYAEKGLKSSV
jgi:hypothetical protein